MMNLLFLDTETGGIPLGHSVLTVTFTELNFTDTTINQVSELDLKVIPDNFVMTINPEALNINGINLVEHAREAITYSAANKKIIQYLAERYKENQAKLLLVGQNINFDLQHLNTCNIINDFDLYRYTDRRVLDIMGVSQFAKFCGKIPIEQSVSLASIAKHLGIDIDKTKLHSAKYDNHLAAVVLFKLRKLLTSE